TRRRGAAPVHGAEPDPGVRQRHRPQHMLRLGPHLEESALDDAPVALDPSFLELWAADKPQPVEIAGILGKQHLVVADPRRTGRPAVVAAVAQHPLEHDRPSRKRDEPIAGRDPVLPRPAGVAGQDHLGRNTVRRSQRSKHPVDRIGYRILTDLLDPDIAQVPALIAHRVGDVLEVAERDTTAVRHSPRQLALVEPTAKEAIDLTGPLDGIHKRHRRAPRAIALHAWHSARSMVILRYPKMGPDLAPPE